MELKDELLFELYFRYKNLTKEEGDFYLDVLRKCKEVVDSDHGFNTKYDIVEMSLSKLDDESVLFNGSMTNGSENRFISGNIVNRRNKTYVTMNIERLCDEENRYYSSLDVFTFKHSEVRRDTYYKDGRCFEAYYKPFDERSMEEYKLSKIYRG